MEKEKENEALKSQLENALSEITNLKKSNKELQNSLNAYKNKEVESNFNKKLEANKIDVKNNEILKAAINGLYGSFNEENIDKFFKEKDFSIFKIKEEVKNPLDEIEESKDNGKDVGKEKKDENVIYIRRKQN